MAVLLTGREVEPWLKLAVGEDNMVATEPLRVVEEEDQRVRIQCADGVLEIDFYDEKARKTNEAGESFVYLGGLDEANDGKGWLRES